MSTFLIPFDQWYREGMKMTLGQLHIIQSAGQNFGNPIMGMYLHGWIERELGGGGGGGVRLYEQKTVEALASSILERYSKSNALVQQSWLNHYSDAFAI